MKIFISIIIAMCIISCTDYTSGKRFEDDYVVIVGTIYAGEFITMDNPIIVGKTIDVSGGNLLDLVDATAEVGILDTASEIFYPLSFGIDISGNGDSLRVKIGYYDADEAFIPESGKTYRLTAIVSGDTIWAETIVPEPFQVEYNPGYTACADTIYPQIPHSHVDSHYPLQIRLSSPENILVYMEYYCLEEWNNAFFVLSTYLGDRPDSPSDYENPIVGGSPRRESYMSEMIPNSDGIVTIPFNQVHYFFYGRYKTTIHTIDENFYRYRYKNQGYFHGGVVGGIGYFGSAVRVSLYTHIVE